MCAVAPAAKAVYHGKVGICRDLIYGTIVYDNAFQVREDLAEDACDSAQQERGSIIAGDYDADEMEISLLHLICGPELVSGTQRSFQRLVLMQRDAFL